MKKLTFYLLVLSSTMIFTQVANFKSKYQLPNEIKETSGLLFINDKIITHNDSGDAASLYELDNASGAILRTINITNATHTDWEDIAEDGTHIYIGDFGNNNGDRTDLKIYKILKSDFESNTAISAEIIAFSYEDQTDFTTKPNANNFDAESLIEYQNSLYIFSKNWVDGKTRVYKLPTTAGTYTATKVSEANVEGLITGATTVNGHIILCGYDATAPFIVFIDQNRSSDDNVFSDGFDKYALTNELGAVSQIEGITALDNGTFYVSREEFNNQFIMTDARLFEYTDARALRLSTENFTLNRLSVSPNPTKNTINIKSNLPIKHITLYNILGKKVMTIHQPKNEIDISHQQKGVYILKVLFTDNKVISQKIIKL